MTAHQSPDNVLWRKGIDQGQNIYKCQRKKTVFHNSSPNKNILQDEGNSKQSSEEGELKM